MAATRLTSNQHHDVPPQVRAACRLVALTDTTAPFAAAVARGCSSKGVRSRKFPDDAPRRQRWMAARSPVPLLRSVPSITAFGWPSCLHAPCVAWRMERIRLVAGVIDEAL